MKDKHAGRIAANTVLGLIMLLPLYWTFITSVKEKDDIYRQPPQIFPQKINFDNYREILFRNDGVFLRYLKNSVTTALITMVLVAVISLLAGYSFSKLQLVGKRFFLLLILSALMIPFQTLMIPLYSIIIKVLPKA